MHALRLRDGARIPQIAERRHEQLAIRRHGRVEDLVSRGAGELHVKIHAGLGVRDALADHRASLLHVLRESRDRCRVGALRGERGRRRLHDRACLGELGEGHALQTDHRRERFGDPVGARVRDEGPAGRADLHADEAAGLEHAKRVADGDARDAELLGELAFRLEAVPRGQLRREDRALDLGDDLTRGTRLMDRGEHSARMV